MTIVADASVWVHYLIGALDDEERITLLDSDPVSPPHVDFEVGSALLRQERRGHLDAGAARALMGEFSAMPFRRQRHADDFGDALDLIDNATYADALYVTMARRLHLPLLTSDAGMAECARIAEVDVRIIRAE